MRRSFVATLTLCCACGAFPDVDVYSGARADASEDAIADGALVETGADVARIDGGLGFCASSSHTFCADFDEGSLLAGWDGSNTDPTGAMSLDPNAKSAPSSALMTLQRHETQVLYENLEKAWPKTGHVVVEFDILVETPAWKMNDVNAGIVTMSFNPIGNIAVSYGQGYVTIGAMGGQMNGNGPLPSGSWFHMKLDADPAGSLHVLAADQTIDQTFPKVVGQTKTTLNLGISGYNSPCPEFRVHYDNVTVDFL